MNELTQRLYDDMLEKAQDYIDAYNEGGHGKKELKLKREAANAACSSFNLQTSKDCYKAWAADGNPVKRAAEQYLIPGAKRIAFKADPDTDVMDYEIKDTEYPVNLPMMQKTLGAGVFNDAGWFNKASKLAVIVAENLNERCGGSSKFTYQVSSAARAFNFPADVNPLSDDGVVYALQIVMDSILFIDDPEHPGQNKIHVQLCTDSTGRPYAKEWTVIRERMTKDAGRNKVAICNTGKFTDYILQAINGIITDGTFSLVADAPDADPNEEEAKDDAEQTEETVTEEA